jgi:type IV pilus assembly protein PilM
MSIISGKYYPIGLDISDLSLKSVQLNKKGKKIRIQALNEVELPAGVVENGYIADKDKLIKKIKELWKDPIYGSMNSDKVVASLPDPKSFTKLISVDNGLNNISEIIEIEIEKHIPYLIDKVYYDWQVIEKRRDTSSVLIGACPKEISDSYYDILSEAGLKVEALEMEAVAISRALLKEENPFINKKEKGSYLIINLGRSRTTFIVYAENTLVFTTDINIGGNSMTEEISRGLGVSQKEAEKKKKQYSLGKAGESSIEVEKVVNDNFMQINKKINEILGFYGNRYLKRDKINSILLVGGGANYKGIESFFNSAKTKSVLGNPIIHLSTTKEEVFKDVFHKEFTKNSQNPILSFTSAIGLALKNLFDQSL